MEYSATNKKSDKPFVEESDLDFEQFVDLCNQEVKLTHYPRATEKQHNILVYQGSDLMDEYCRDTSSNGLKSELHTCLFEGPGIFIVKGFYQDSSIIDQSTRIFKEIIEAEKGSSIQKGDHFAKAGANERIWNSFQKVGEASPSVFIDYYKNPLYALVSESWLGPAYQITAQVNIVKPGGQAQSPHRDYHLGFQPNSSVAAYPRSMQIASQFLTLQGAIVHSDMPIASGPTLLLPFSQQYDLGYLAYRDSRFKQFFLENAVQISAKKGDAMFFNPALFHGAGNNQTSKDRIANLIQVSSAFGKTMESIDRYHLMKTIYPSLIQGIQASSISDHELSALIAATADGYPFPTNLDTMPPVGGNAPESMQGLLLRALDEKLSPASFEAEINLYKGQRSA